MARPPTSSEYNAWRNAKARCENPRHPQYPSYGGRGITMAPEWRTNPTRFLADMGPRPSPEHSLDRIDNEGPYAPGNCRWATMAEQMRNTRDNRWYTYQGETLCLFDWCHRYQIDMGTMRRRLGLGMPFAEAILLRPSKGHNFSGMYTQVSDAAMDRGMDALEAKMAHTPLTIEEPVNEG